MALNREIVAGCFDGRISGEDNPFHGENGETYCRFDAIRIEDFKVVFQWKGQDIAELPYGKSEGDILTLDGLEGRYRIRVECE